MTKARDLAELIGNSLIDGDEIATGAVGTSNLAATLDFSSKTMVMANDQLSGDKIHGGTISGFTSTGIDDNSTANVLTVVDGPKIGIGYNNPQNSIHVLGNSVTPNVGLTLQTNDTANAVASINLMSRVADNTNRTVSIQNILGRLDINANMDIHGVGTNFKSESYNIINLQTDSNDDQTSTDGIFKITNGSAATTKAEFRWDESEDLVHISYGDHGRHISIASNGNVGVGTGSTTPASPLHVQADGVAIRLDGTGNTSRKIFFRSTTNANKAEIYADGGLKIWTDDAGSDLLLAPAGSLLMTTMPTVIVDDATEYSTTEASELNPVATDALYLHNEENSSTNGRVSIHMRSSGGGGAASARITLKNNRSGSSALGFFMRDNAHTTEQKEKMYLDSDGNLSLTGTASLVITATPGTVAGNNSAIALGRTDGSNNIQMNTALAVDVAIGGIAGVTVGATNGNTPSTRLRSANSANGHIVISPKGVEKIRITATGETEFYDEVLLQNATTAPTNSSSNPPVLKFSGRGWDSNYGSKEIRGQIEYSASYGDYGHGATQGALIFSTKGAGGLNSAPDTLQEGMRLAAGSDDYGSPRLGIGTTGPARTLHVDTTSGYVKRESRGSNYQFDTKIDNVLAGSNIDYVMEPLQANSGYQWRTSNSSNTLVDAVAINRGGQLGVLTTNPTHDFHVNGSSRFQGDTTYQDTNNNFYGGIVTVTPNYTEYQYYWNGLYNHETNIYVPSYFMSEITFTQHQTNGGTDINRHFVGKFANNHDHHELETVHDSGSTWAMTTTLSVSDHNLTSSGAHGRLRIVETYGSGSYSKSTLTMRVYFGGPSNITHAIT